MSLLQSPFYYKFTVSGLSRYAFCSKRAKIELFSRPKFSGSFSKNKYMVKGTQMHESFNSWAKSFDRIKVLYLLKSIQLPYRKVIDNYEIRGLFDDLRVIRNVQNNSKSISFIEIKTTNHRRLWSNEEAMAVFQLQLYIWIMREYVEKLGYRIHKRHYVEIYSQKDSHLIKRIVVTEDKTIESRLRYIFRSFQGLERMKVEPLWMCKRCPKNIKNVCDWFKERNVK